jgi:adenosylmethionine-8-amino-7-oxononanoate aminotransferase
MAAAGAQLERLAFNTLWSTAHPAALELAQRLAALAPAGIEKVFFTSGGSEAVEAAWKIVRQFHIANGEPQRRKAIARDIAYHGVTLRALALTGVAGFKEPFGPPAIETRHVSNTNAFRRSRIAGELRSELLGELERAVLDEGPDSGFLLGPRARQRRR